MTSNNFSTNFQSNARALSTLMIKLSGSENRDLFETVIADEVKNAPALSQALCDRVSGIHMTREAIDLTSRAVITADKLNITEMLAVYFKLLNARAQMNFKNAASALKELGLPKDMANLTIAQSLPHPFVIKYLFMKCENDTGFDENLFEDLLDQTGINLTAEYQAIDEMRNNCGSDDLPAAIDPKIYFDYQYGTRDIQRLGHCIIQHQMTALEVKNHDHTEKAFVNPEFLAICDLIAQNHQTLTWLNLSERKLLRLPRLIKKLKQCEKLDLSDEQKEEFYNIYMDYAPKNLLTSALLDSYVGATSLCAKAEGRIANPAIRNLALASTLLLSSAGLDVAKANSGVNKETILLMSSLFSSMSFCALKASLYDVKRAGMMKFQLSLLTSLFMLYYALHYLAPDPNRPIQYFIPIPYATIFLALFSISDSIGKGYFK